MSINPMSTPGPWTMVAEGYAAETQPVLKQYCEGALSAAGFEGADKVLDVACGPGTLSLLIADVAEEIHSVDFSQAMLDCLECEIARRGIRNVTSHLMDGQNLEFAENSFDWSFSIFGVLFFPDREQGFREMLRTLRPGGRAVVTSWAPIQNSTLMQAMVGAVRSAFGGESPPALPLSDPDVFRSEMSSAGFVDVRVAAIDGDWPMKDAESFLDSMVQGSAPCAVMRSQIGELGWASKREIMLTYLRQNETTPTVLHSGAWVGVGIKPETS